MQPRFRSMWERYCRGVQAIVYVVDSSDVEGLEQVHLQCLLRPFCMSVPCSMHYWDQLYACLLLPCMRLVLRMQRQLPDA